MANQLSSLWRLAVLALALSLPAWGAQAAPSYMIESLEMNFQDEVSYAADEGKHVVLFIHQQGCPYCDKMRARVFPHPEVEKYFAEKFVMIPMNMKGALPVVMPDGTDSTEKGYATKLRVRATPVMIFFGQDGAVALRTTGYLDPKRFIKAGQFVVDGVYKSGTSFFRYLRDGGSGS